MYTSIYIHIPVCIQKCLYCDFFSVPSASLPECFSFDEFVSALSVEIEAKKKLYGASGFDTVYIGGGTPSLIPEKNAEDLCRIIDLSGAKRICEWTVEMNPGDITPEKLSVWQDGGVSRLSLGIQTFDRKILNAVSRRNSPEENHRALDFISGYWKKDLSVDFIAGLPFQTEASLLDDLGLVMDYSPSHISLYQLSVEEGTPLAEKVGAGAMPLPSEDEASGIWFAGKKFLEDSGFIRYEISNFSRPGFESRHNLTYWRLNSFIGAGPGASGTLVRGDSCIRFENTKNIAEWLSFWKNYSGSVCFCGDSGLALPEDIPMETCKISVQDFVLETIMMGMRLSSGIDMKVFFERFGTDIFSCIGNVLDKWAGRGMIRIEGGNIFLTEEGSMFLNRFLLDCAEEISVTGRVLFR